METDATSDAPGEAPKGDCGAAPMGGGMRSPVIKRKSLLPGATGERSASLLSAGFSPEAAETGDAHDLQARAWVSVRLQRVQ